MEKNKKTLIFGVLEIKTKRIKDICELINTYNSILF